MKSYTVSLGMVAVGVASLSIAGWLTATIMMLTLRRLERRFHHVPSSGPIRGVE
jgi:hypothetical protein